MMDVVKSYPDELMKELEFIKELGYEIRVQLNNLSDDYGNKIEFISKNCANSKL